MSSPTKPRQVPDKDVLYKLIVQGNKYREIESYLNSSDYTRETKVEWILYPRNNSRRSLFHAMCKMICPMYIIDQVFDILGEEEISSPTCTDLVSAYLWNQKDVKKITVIIREIMEKLKNHPEVKLQLFLEAIVNRKDITSSIPPMPLVFNHIRSILLSCTQSIPLTKYNVEIMQSGWNLKTTKSFKKLEHQLKGGPAFQSDGHNDTEFHEATILEIFMHRHISSDIIIDLLERGKKELVMLSKRSLLEGAIYEYEHDFVKIIERLIHYGGRELVMLERSWWNNNTRKMNFFHFFSEYKEELLSKELDMYYRAKKKFRDEIQQTIAKIMGLMLDTGGKELVLQTNEDGQSILHTFAYFDYYEFVPIVRRIVEIGGESLFKIQDKKGDTILHLLLRQNDISSCFCETLVDIMGLMLDTSGKELVLQTNEDGQSILHTFTHFKHDEFVPIVRRIVEIGGERLLKIQDKKGNTILHQLLQQSYISSCFYETLVNIMGLMLDAGGKELVLQTNEDGQSILHTFAYFDYWELVPIVRRIVEIGGESLFKIQDKKGDTILHLLLRQNDISSCFCETLVDIMGLMLDTSGKELVLQTNEDGQSILHTFTHFKHDEFVPIVRRIVEIGGERLFKIQDKKGNTILHQLLQQSYISSECHNEEESVDSNECHNEVESVDSSECHDNEEESVDSSECHNNEEESVDSSECHDNEEESVDSSECHNEEESVDSSECHNEEESVERKNDEKKQVLELYMNTLADNKEVVIIRNNNGKTALDLALESQNEPCIDILTELTDEKSILNEDTQEGKTVLHKACERKMYDEIQRFLEIGGKELLMKQDVQGNSAIHLLSTCCERHDKQFQCVRDMMKIGGKDIFTTKNNEGNKPPILLHVDQYTQDAQQLLQMEIQQLNKQLVLEEKRGQNEIEIVKKWHEDRHEESVTVFEKQKKEIQMLKEVEKSMKKDLDNQKEMIEKLKELSDKKEHENIPLKQDIERLQQELSKENLMKDEFEEESSRPTKELCEVEESENRVGKIQKELECSICLDPFEDPHVVPECCHRFCFKCIEKSMKKSGKECPMCRKRITSKRSLRRDELIGKITKIFFSNDNGGDENKDQHLTKSTKAKSSTEIQQHEEEVTLMKEKLDSQEEMLKQSTSKFSQLEKRIAEKDGVITAKEHENNALKQEIDTVKLQLSSSLQEEVTSMKEKLDSQEELLKQSASNVSQLEKRIAEKDEASLSLKEVITSKESENNALKQEINNLKLQLSSSLSSKRSRDENESTNNDEDDIIPRKRSKTNELEASRFGMNESLESENEDLLQQLKKEKASHSKTIERLENARKKLKEVYRAHQR